MERNIELYSDMKENSIVKIEDANKKSTYTRAVLEELPQWFGNKEAVDEYVEDARETLYWAAIDRDNECIGFFSIKMQYGYTGDIFVCGVLPEYRNKGVGKSLYYAAEKYLVQKGCKYVIVKTLSDIANYEPYEQTRRFYESVGFEALITLTEMWDEENPCLIMIKVIRLLGDYA